MTMIAIGADTRARFATAFVSGGHAVGIEALAARLKRGDRSTGGELELAAAFAEAAFAAPWRIAEIYDAAARGWVGEAVDGPPIPVEAQTPLPPLEGFWSPFWDLVAAEGLSAGETTTRTALLAIGLHPDFQAATARVCAAWPSVTEAAKAGFPARVQLADIAACPPGSLGEEFYRLVVDNHFDLEVLDRDALGLAGLTPPLDYLNARMLQAHDLWHIVAGYRTTALHEVAISSFQMAQFGHTYSAMFLAMVAASGAVRDPAFFAMLMDTILSAWTHGRRTPPMLLIRWEEVWDRPTETIRRQFGVTPYASPYPADIFEQLAEATAAAVAA